MSIKADIEDIFSLNGSLSQVVPEYRNRPGQTEMALRVAEAIQEKKTLICEAGTGTGKTFAYLIPAFLYGKKIIIATGTKTLQDQLFEKDIKVIRDALKLPITVAKLKGRANYLCHHQIEKTKSQRSFTTVREVELLTKFENMLETSDSGDISEMDVPEENLGIRASVVSTRENCLGSDCPHIGKCFILKARKRALEAEVIVVNHHLFFADLALKQDGFGELLPDCDVVIFDEAHQISDVATDFFGLNLGTNQMNELIRDLRYGLALLDEDLEEIDARVDSFEKATRDFHITFQGIKGRQDIGNGTKYPNIVKSAKTLATASNKVREGVGSLEFMNSELVRCDERLSEVISFLNSWSEIDSSENIRWFDVNLKSIRLHTTPINIADILKPIVYDEGRSWIFTSATLSVSGDASYFTEQLGLEETEFSNWESPFDYQGNSLLYIPRDMPEPAHFNYAESVVSQSIELIIASRGRCMMLFTSLGAMRHAKKLLSSIFEEREVDIPLLLQGDGSKFELLNQFKKLKHAVLLGSHSFWEGVDVRGEGLVLVIIDKLPFSVPDDPITAGRIEYLRSRGKNPFMEFQIPEAVISLKQGAGRLIRDEQDKGVLMLCDPRLLSRPYGRRIWKSLPPMRRTQDAFEAISFLRDS